MPKFRVKISDAGEGMRRVHRDGGTLGHGSIESCCVAACLGTSDLGTYEVTVEKVAPTAARIERPCNAGNEEGFEFFCGRCGLLVAKDAEIGMADLRIGGDGKPLVEE